MNEIMRIHLAKAPYNIEVQAHRALRDYLDAIKKMLHADSEAMREIESRMSELLGERGVSGDSVITEADVLALQKQLGDPQDFAGDDGDDDQTNRKTAKRLMRDPSNALLGGVCSGIAAYFGWDVVWVRVVTLLLIAVTGGMAILVYLVLLIVVPEAKTATDRLTMSGAPVTLEALKQISATTPQVTEPTLLKYSRYGLGGIFIIGGVLSFGMTVAIAWVMATQSDDYWMFGSTPIKSLALGLMTTGSIMFAVLCALIAKMLFTRTVGRRLIIASIIVTLVGAGSFGTGVSITLAQMQDFHKKTTMDDVTKQLDVRTHLHGINKIDVQSRGINLRYSVSDTARTGSYTYNSINISNPKVVLTKVGDTLLIEGSFSDGPGCRVRYVDCDTTTVNLYLSGPPVAYIKTNALEVAYTTTRQTSLTVEQQSETGVIVSSTGIIDTLKLTTANDSFFDATDAIVSAVQLDGQRGTSSFANIASLFITTPTVSCSTSVMEVSARHVGTLQVNGETVQPAATYLCLDLRVGSNN